MVQSRIPVILDPVSSHFAKGVALFLSAWSGDRNRRGTLQMRGRALAILLGQKRAGVLSARRLK
jgi:hypothetical protein